MPPPHSPFSRPPYLMGSFPKWLYQTMLSPASYERWTHSTSSPMCSIASVSPLTFNHVSGFVQVSYSSNIYFHVNQWCWASFHLFPGHLDILFCEVLSQKFCSSVFVIDQLTNMCESVSGLSIVFHWSDSGPYLCPFWVYFLIKT